MESCVRCKVRIDLHYIVNRDMRPIISSDQLCLRCFESCAKDKGYEIVTVFPILRQGNRS